MAIGILGAGGRASSLCSLVGYSGGVGSAGFAEETKGTTAVKPWAPHRFPLQRNPSFRLLARFHWKSARIFLLEAESLVRPVFCSCAVVS
jgi:hypothetical protein